MGNGDYSGTLDLETKQFYLHPDDPYYLVTIVSSCPKFDNESLSSYEADDDKDLINEIIPSSDAIPDITREPSPSPESLSPGKPSPSPELPSPPDPSLPQKPSPTRKKRFYRKHTNEDIYRFFDVYLNMGPPNIAKAARLADVLESTARRWVLKFKQSGETKIPYLVKHGWVRNMEFGVEHEEFVNLYYDQLQKEDRQLYVDNLIDEMSKRFDGLHLSKDEAHKLLAQCNLDTRML